MKGFDFGQIGNIISNIMDTDYIDIKRDVDSSLVEVYSNIPCHIAYVSIDNPNADTVDIKPIIQGITVHIPLWVDVRNNDFIIAKKIDSNGNIAGVYSGRCGNPVVSQGRKKVLMNMSATEPEEPTPVPTENNFQVVIGYSSDNERIKPSMTVYVKEGDNYSVSAPSIEGYTAVSYKLDGESFIGTSVSITDIDDNHSIEFIYSAVETPDAFAFLVNGLYTKDDGKLANGWHTYKSVNIDSISYSENVYIITSDNVEFEHRDNGKILSIKKNTNLVLFPTNTFVRINDVTVSGGKATFTAVPFNPTQEQSNFYKTRWYD